jgi:hypothetical protein
MLSNYGSFPIFVRNRTGNGVTGKTNNIKQTTSEELDEV